MILDSQILTNCLKFITARENALHDQDMYQNKACLLYTSDAADES